MIQIAGVMLMKSRRRKKPEFKPFDASRVESPSPNTLEHALEEGVMIAEFATRMALKNKITISALRDGIAFDPERLAPVASDLLRALADESSGDAARIAAEREWAAYLDGPSEHVHDYRPVDDLNLRRREALARSLAETLTDRAGDGAYILDLIERARQDAWFDISRAITDKLDAGSVSAEADPAERLQRIQDFIELDLQALKDARGHDSA